MADKKKGKADDKGKKGKKGKGEGEDPQEDILSVAAHPKAKAQVRRARAWGGLIGFAVTIYLSLKAGVPADIAGGRALVAGLVGYMVGWFASVTVWRQIMVAELRAKAEEVKQRRADAAAAAAQNALPPKQ